MAGCQNIRRAYCRGIILVWYVFKCFAWTQGAVGVLVQAIVDYAGRSDEYEKGWDWGRVTVYRICAMMGSVVFPSGVMTSSRERLHGMLFHVGIALILAFRLVPTLLGSTI